jgi:hypothetical protein
MISIRRIFGLRRLPTRSSAQMRHTFAGGELRRARFQKTADGELAAN